LIYVPAKAPPRGYALFVFVSPWSDAKLPSGWAQVLDRYNVIFVTAQNSGNGASVLDRREPLSLLAEQNVAALYPIDTSRIYIGGFSGGSRIAMRLALEYPDVFNGAILNAGSDPIGDALIPLPKKELFQRFQTSSQLVYLTGDDDEIHLAMDVVSRKSMRDWCVSKIDVEEIARAGHDVAMPAALSRALEVLDTPPPPSASETLECRSKIDSELSNQFRMLDETIRGGDRAAARALLKSIDERFGGLAAPQSVQMDDELLQQEGSPP